MEVDDRSIQDISEDEENYIPKHSRFCTQDPCVECNRP